MQNRRSFIRTAAGLAAASSTVLGANDRVRMGIIGTGMRGMQVWTAFSQNTDCVFAAACDVDSTRLDSAAQRIGGNPQKYKDYRRILEDKDIDAVLVATPDHWHSQMTIDAIAAGKDVYVEKPASNTLAAAIRMREAYSKSKQVVQLGTQQRSWPHFLECCKMIRDGKIGVVSQAVCTYQGGYGSVPQPAEAPPATLDWDLWQGPAPHKPYSPSRRRWRAFYDYGGGLVTDWGVHLTDTAILAMAADKLGPSLTAAAAQYVSFPRDPEQVPDTFVCSWQYPNFTMSLTDLRLPGDQGDAIPNNGNYFYGTRGVLQVNRSGYRIWPAPPRPPRPAPAGATTQVAAPQAPAASPLEAVRWIAPAQEGAPDPDQGTKLHTRNFLDCVKSRNKPNAELEIGFHATLPCLVGLMAIQQGRAFVWDGNNARPA